MLKVAAIAGVIAFATGCSSSPVSSPADQTIKGLVAAVSSYAPCDAPTQVGGDGRRADCHGGTFFIEAYPNAAEMQASLGRLDGVQSDVLLGDTWLARANMSDELAELHRLLGGTVVHRPA